MGCSVCESNNRSYVCTTCLNSSVLTDRRQHLQQLLKKRETVLTRLSELLAAKVSQHSLRAGFAFSASCL